MTRVTHLWILWPSNVIVTLTFAITVLMFVAKRSESHLQCCGRYREQRSYQNRS